MMPQKELTIRERLENLLKVTLGLVQAEWSVERERDVLNLFIEASKSFQQRALDEAKEAARKKPDSVIGMDTDSFFKIYAPSSSAPQGYMSISKAHLLDPEFFPYVKGAIQVLREGKRRADRFDLNSIQEAAQSAFGENVVTCKMIADDSEHKENVRIIISHAAVALVSFQKASEEIEEHVRDTMKGALTAWKDTTGLFVRNYPEDGVGKTRILFNPAYADEFIGACQALPNKLSPQAMKEQFGLQ